MADANIRKVFQWSFKFGEHLPLPQPHFFLFPGQRFFSSSATL